MTRLASRFNNVFRSKYFDGSLSDFDYKSLESQQDKIGKLPFLVVDNPVMSVADVRAVVIDAKRRFNVALAIVDYVGILRAPKSQNREQEISKISSGLKSIAREMELPLLVVSQLSRAVEARNPPIPRLADLRDSGSLEQDADVVMLLFRPSYYDPNLPDTLDVHIAKARNSQTLLIKGLSYNRSTGKIGSPEQSTDTSPQKPEVEPDKEQFQTEMTPDERHKEEIEDELPF